MTFDSDIHEYVHALATSPDFAHDSLCLAARPSGLFRSDDGGRTWQLAWPTLQTGDSSLPSAAVAFSPGFRTDHSLFAGLPGAVAWSEDGGQDWRVAPLASPPPFVSVLAISPNYEQDGTVFAGTVEDGVFRTADRGHHWAAWNFGLLDLSVLALAVSPDYARDDTLFAGTDSGIFRSTTGGRAWRDVEAGPDGKRSTDFAPVLSLALSPGFAADGVLFAGTEAHGLFRSADRGRTWSAVGASAITGAVNGLILAPDYPRRPHMLALLGDGIAVSRDDGVTWADWPAAEHSTDGLTCLAAPLGIDPGDPLLVATASGKVLRL